jgi:phage terminase large subunit-like protein
MQYDRNENRLPSKGSSPDKIDFVAALLNAIGLWLHDRGEQRMGGSYLFEEDSKIIKV